MDTANNNNGHQPTTINHQYPVSGSIHTAQLAAGSNNNPQNLVSENYHGYPSIHSTEVGGYNKQQPYAEKNDNECELINNIFS